MHKEILKVLFQSSEFAATPFPFTHISVRHRKPLWLGTAPSKRFRIPKRAVQPERDDLEVRRLARIDKTANKAILFYHASLNAKRSETAPEVIEEQKRIEKEDWERSLFLNNEWNAQVAIEREQRLAIEKEQKKVQILAEIEAKTAKEREDIARVEQQVRAEIEKSKTFITRDNIDEHIEKVLSSHVDFNFAIDKNGNVYQGMKTNPLNSKESAELQVEQ